MPNLLMLKYPESTKVKHVLEILCNVIEICNLEICNVLEMCNVYELCNASD